MSAAARMAIDWVEQGLVPDAVIRQGIRRLLARRLEEMRADDCDASAAAQEDLIRQMEASPVALAPELANAQHYEVPAGFFEQVLGPRRKYSACDWGGDATGLDRAEARALELVCTPAWRTVRTSWIWAAAGAACSYGWLSTTPRPGSSRCPIPACSGCTSRNRRSGRG
jgi:hypothetical protein